MTHRSRRFAAAGRAAALLGLAGAATQAGQPLPPTRPPASGAAPQPVEAVPVVPVAQPEVVETPAIPGGVPGLNDAEARRVRREGVVVRPFNLQAPSFYALKARDSGRIINFLMTTRAEPLNWREFRGKVVIVSGREYLDHRSIWKGIPLLNVDTIEAVR